MFHQPRSFYAVLALALSALSLETSADHATPIRCASFSTKTPAFQHSSGLGDPSQQGRFSPSTGSMTTQTSRAASPFGGLRPSMELRKSSMSQGVNEDSQMHFFSIPVGAVAEDAVEALEVKEDTRMKFHSIRVGAHAAQRAGVHAMTRSSSSNILVFDGDH